MKKATQMFAAVIAMFFVAGIASATDYQYVWQEFMRTHLPTNGIVAGAALPAVNLINATNLNAASIKAGTVMSVVDGSAITNLTTVGLTRTTLVSDISASTITIVGGRIISINP